MIAFRCHRPIRTNACPLKRSEKSLRRKRFLSVVNVIVNGIGPRGKRKIGWRMGTYKRKWRGVIPFVLGIFRSAPRPLILRPTLRSHVPKPEIRKTPEHVNWTIIFKIRVRVSVCPFYFLSPGFPTSLLCFSTCPRRLEIKPMDLARLLIANFSKPYPLFRRNSFTSLC